MTAVNRKPFLSMFTVYDSPADYPGRFVVRRFTIGRGSDNHDPVPDPEPMFVGPDLESARDAIPLSADACLHRSPEDEPSIVETWV
jgi:hypothetical protein